MQWNELTVISCYIFPNVDDTIYEEFLDELDDGIQEAGKDLIGGDFNSKSVLWGCKHDNIRGDRLARWCASRDMILVNIGNQPTCVRPQGTSIVDVTWSNSTVKSRITQWIVLEDETLSDHKYIRSSLLLIRTIVLYIEKRSTSDGHIKNLIMICTKRLWNGVASDSRS